MYSIEFITQNEKNFSKTLEWLTDDLIKKSTPLISQTLNDKFKQNIKNEVDASGNKFKDISNKTRNKKGRGGKSAKILQDNGFLIGGMFYKIREGSILFYNSTEYAKYHQEGKGSLPKRTIFPEQGEQYVIDMIMKVFDYELKKNI